MLKRKAKVAPNADDLFENGVNLFVDKPADQGSDQSDDDTTDSEESVYSGLEEEEEDSEDEDTSEDSEIDIDDSEGSVEDDDSDGNDDDDGDDDDDDGDDNKEEGVDIVSNNKNILSKKKTNTENTKKVTDNLKNTQKEKELEQGEQKVETEISEALKAQSVSSHPNDIKKNRKKIKSGEVHAESLTEKKIEGTQDKEDTETAVTKPDEYEYDSSDEEDIRNTIGNIPMEWYKNMTHIGYDIEGRKLIKPKQGDKLDDFLNKADDANYWRTVTNKLTGQNVVLSKDDVDLVQNLMTRRHPTASESELYAPWIDFFTNEEMIHPLSNRPEHKRSFIPSKWERLKVGQMVHALKKGWMKFSDPEKKEMEEEEEEIPKYYDIWKDENESEINKRFQQHIPAPKMALPGHEESYNPPAEYLFTKEEEAQWKEKEPSERRINFIPKKFSSLRAVTAYPRFINERFERCLDLYLCPRQRKVRMNVDPEDLIPKLPKPKDLQPFPTTQAIVYSGHKDMVRSVTVDPSGQWIASGSDDMTVKIWEIITGRCMKTFEMGSKVNCIAWNPNPAVYLIACALEKSIVLINPGMGDKLQVNNTDNMVTSFEAEDESGTSTTWSVFEGEEYEKGFRLKVTHNHEVSQVTWHGKGDYFANVLPQGMSKSVCIHQLSRRRSQYPFSKSKGLVQCVKFHPLRPFLFVATQRYIRVYNLLKQEMSKKLTGNCKWISSMDVHPEGDNVIIGSYDTRLNWFDLDLSTKPYQTLKHHKKAVRSVCYHKRYPLFASASDDTSVIVSHGMVYNDLLQNPLIVPVKILRGHATTKDVGVLDCVFHPTQPWIFSSGADATIRLYT